MMCISTMRKIQDLKYDMHDQRMTGYFNFEAKKKLLAILWECEKALENAPTFVGEEEWLKEIGKLPGNV